MINEMLVYAARACDYDPLPGFSEMHFCVTKNDQTGYTDEWNPLINASDCAEMCATLGIGTTWWWGSKEVECQCGYLFECVEFFNHKVRYVDHDNSRMKAWMFAATVVAARIGKRRCGTK